MLHLQSLLSKVIIYIGISYYHFFERIPEKSRFARFTEAAGSYKNVLATLSWARYCEVTWFKSFLEFFLFLVIISKKVLTPSSSKRCRWTILSERKNNLQFLRLFTFLSIFPALLASYCGKAKMYLNLKTD